MASAHEEVKTKVFKLSMVAVAGKFRGMRGATYKLARKYHGYRLMEGPPGVRYGDTTQTSSNIYIDLYFLDYRELTDFKQSVSDLHYRLPDLIARAGLEHKPTIQSEAATAFFDLCSHLEAVTDVEFQETTPPGSIDYDRALQDLASFATASEPATKKSKSSSSRASSVGRNSGKLGSSRSSGRVGKLKAVSDTSPLFQWQTFEDTDEIPNPYECHVYPKEKGGSSHTDNLIAASWSFHQLFDGLKLQFPPKVPGLVVDFLRADGSFIDASDGTRYKVDVRIRFFDDVHNVRLRKNFVDTLKAKSKVNADGSIETFVYVLNVNDFRTNLELKNVLTEGMWRKYRAGELKD